MIKIYKICFVIVFIIVSDYVTNGGLKALALQANSEFKARAALAFIFLPIFYWIFPNAIYGIQPTLDKLESKFRAYREKKRLAKQNIVVLDDGEYYKKYENQPISKKRMMFWILALWITCLIAAVEILYFFPIKIGENPMGIVAIVSLSIGTLIVALVFAYLYSWLTGR